MWRVSKRYATMYCLKDVPVIFGGCQDHPVFKIQFFWIDRVDGGRCARQGWEMYEPSEFDTKVRTQVRNIGTSNSNLLGKFCRTCTHPRSLSTKPRFDLSSFIQQCFLSRKVSQKDF